MRGVIRRPKPDYILRRRATTNVRALFVTVNVRMHATRANHGWVGFGGGGRGTRVSFAVGPSSVTARPRGGKISGNSAICFFKKLVKTVNAVYIIRQQNIENNVIFTRLARDNSRILKYRKG